MQVLIVSALLATAAALPQGYQPPVQTYRPQGPGPIQCGPGEVPKGDGTCAQPVVTRNLYLYNAPEQQLTYGPVPEFPVPKVHMNFVFVKTPNAGAGPAPIVAPAPQQKTLVYLLSKRPEAIQQEVVEVEATPSQPEVFFVQYSDGENAQLPGGIDLQTALSQAAQQGQVVAGPAGDFGGSHGGQFVQQGLVHHGSSEEQFHVTSGQGHTIIGGGGGHGGQLSYGQ